MALESLHEAADHPEVTEGMKWECFIEAGSNLKAFRILQEIFKMDFNKLFKREEYFLSDIGFVEQPYEQNLLHLSCEFGWNNIVQELIENHKVDVNIPDSRGNTCWEKIEALVLNGELPANLIGYLKRRN